MGPEFCLASSDLVVKLELYRRQWNHRAKDKERGKHEIEKWTRGARQFISIWPLLGTWLIKVEIHNSLSYLIANQASRQNHWKTTPNHAGGSGICQKRHLWTQVIFAKKEGLVFTEPRDSGSRSILLPNPIGWWWPAKGSGGATAILPWDLWLGTGQDRDEKKTSWNKRLQQWVLQPGAVSCRWAFQGCRAVTMYSWGLQHWAVGRSLVPKYSLWLGFFLAYRI